MIIHKDDEMGDVFIDSRGGLPSIKGQIQILEPLLSNRALKEGDYWRIIPFKWLEDWKSYVKSDSDICGELDISTLFTNGKLRPGLREERDYTLVPEEAYTLLNSWHGQGHGGKPHDNRRKVIKVGKFTVRTLVEVYPVNITIYTNFDSNDESNGTSRKYTLKHFQRNQSKADMIRDILVGAKADDLFDRDGTTRIWTRETSEDKWRKVSDDSQSLYELGMTERGELLCEFQNDDGSWPRDQELEESNKPKDKDQVTAAGGKCGLVNLGNTCFMASGVQCLAAVVPLANYFLSSQWQQEVNVNNPLGTGGRLAKSFARLIKDMWSGHESSIAPSDVKRAVGQINTQFSGYAQNDSQELISTLLDALHEDQNRVKNKPYIELADAAGRPDEEVAAEAWAGHLERNNSIITDLFHGQFKSTVRCPSCGRVSVTFDPFCAVSVPLPAATTKSLPFIIVPSQRLADPIKILKAVKRKSTIGDIFEQLEEYKTEQNSKWIATEIYNNRFHKIFMNNDSTNDIRDNDIIVIFEIKENYNPLAIYLEYEVAAVNRREQFSHPFIINVKCDQDSVNSTITSLDLKALIKLEISKLVTTQTYDFKMHQINSYSGSTGVGRFKDDTILKLDEYRSKANLLYISSIWTSEKIVSEPQPVEETDDMETNQDKGIDINQCLKLFTEEEQLREGEEWYCKNCKEHKRAFKHMQIWKLPSVLLLHLKRFHYTRFFRDKVCDLVHFPTKGLDLSNYVLGPGSGMARYNLLGVSNHMGRLGGGHYTANCLHTPTNKWLNFNDNWVSEVSEESAVSNSAYVLFYVREDCDWFPQDPTPKKT